MSEGEIHARHYATGRAVRLSWRGGRITAFSELEEPPEADLWIAPPLLDLQINGYAGVDFQQDNLEQEALLHAARRLREDACPAFFLTLVTDEWSRLTTRFRRLAEQRRQSPELQRAILGWHIEGPFLSAEPGFCGAHDPAVMIDPKPEHIRELKQIAGSTPLLLTIAPERKGADEAIHLASSLGIRVQFGHTNATERQLAGACPGRDAAFTHLGNGCPQQLDRHDNILWRVLDIPWLWVSLIPDGIHVSPYLFRLIHRLKGDLIYYTTDAMSAAGAPSGRYRIGRLEVEVGKDLVVRQPGKSNFAGSALRPIQGVFNAARMLNCPWQEAWRRFSGTPAKLIGLTNDWRVNDPADFCLMEVLPDNRLVDLKVFVNGETATARV
jgi:N-acetylglucosamine-6-phosphate deacetylase